MAVTVNTSTLHYTVKNSLHTKLRYLFVFFLLPIVLLGQEDYFHFEHITIDDGLSQNFVTSIEQDYRGFLWFGTKDGLDRYDGYQIKPYNHIPGDSTSLIDNGVTVIFEDSNRNLWVGAGGLNLYNRYLDQFEPVILASDVPGNLSFLEITDITQGPQGHLWVAIRDVGAYRVERAHPDTAASKRGKADPGPAFQLVGPYLADAGNVPSEKATVQKLIVWRSSLWGVQQNRIVLLRGDDNSHFPAPRQAVFEEVSFPGMPENTIFSSFYADADGSLWIGTNLGLIHLTEPPHSERYRFFPYPEKIFTLKWEGIAKKIISGPDDRLWVATYKGIMLFDRKSENYQHIASDAADPESLSFNNVSDIFLDEGKILWVGTVGMGLNKSKSTSKAFQHFLGKEQTKKVFSLYGLVEGPDKNLWSVSNSGSLIRLDRSSGKVTEIPPDPLDVWAINSIEVDKEGIIWLSNNNKLIRLDPRTQKKEVLMVIPPPGPAYPVDSLFTLTFDQHGRLWACNTGVLRRFEPATGSFTSIPLPRLFLEKVEAVYFDRQDRCWLATLRGLLCYDLVGGEWQYFQADPGREEALNHNRLKCILPDPVDPDRYLWIGSGGGGLNRLDVERGIFSHFTEQEGLADDFVYGILADGSGRLWISTNHGLSRFDPIGGEFTNYTVQDGLQSNEFNSQSYFQSESGALYFGGINGITAFFPDQIQPNPHVPQIVLTDMRLSYEPVRPGKEDSPLEVTITETREVRLNYHQRDLALEFAALDFYRPENNRYRYKLEGFDKDWVEAGTTRRANYTNLPWGHFTFRVQGANNDGVWNESGITLEVFVAPPRWLTWWAFLIYALLLALAGYGVRRYLTEKKRMKDEIRKKHLEAEKLTELNHFKSQFFASVSHEFRTPLTLIQGRVNELLRQPDQEAKLEKLFSIRRNASQLQRLIDQLLDIARLESRKMSLCRKPGDLVHFLRILTYSLQSSAEAKDIELNFVARQDELPAVFDPDALQKIVQNLISNAIKFTSPGGKIEVIVAKTAPASTIQSEEGNSVRVQVIDTGIGIPEKDLAHIFERFYQVGNDTPVSEKGFGLGLNLVWELVTLHKGKIQVQSQEGVGTTFTIDLPLLAAGPFADTPVQPGIDQQLLELEVAEFEGTGLGTVTRRGDNWWPASSKLVLVVEDHSELREYISGILSSEFEVVQATDGREGLEKALDLVPDLLISDVMMPNMDGFELCERLKADQRTSHVPVILLTARAESSDRIRGLELSIDDYLVKPFNEKELKTRVANLLKKQEELKKKYSQSLLGNFMSSEVESGERRFLRQVRTIIEENMGDENFGVVVLAQALAMSPSQLYRKLRALTELSTVQLIQRARMERAAVLIKQGYNVSEVAYMVGLRSPSYFGQLFKKFFGCSPKEYESS